MVSADGLGGSSTRNKEERNISNSQLSWLIFSNLVTGGKTDTASNTSISEFIFNVVK